jgi:hypothetical protein
MDPNQFALFIGAMEAREAHDQEERQAEVTRQEREVARKERQRRLDTQIRAVKPCDGSSVPLVREWLIDIDLARDKLVGNQLEDLTLRLISETVQGPMRRYYERWVIAYAALEDVPALAWPVVKEHLAAAYLTTDEGEYLKSELDSLRQSTYETGGGFGRRFAEAADMEYPVDTRNATIANQLLEKYLRGLRSKELVRRVVQEGAPQNLTEAMASVAAFTAQEERLSRLLKGQPARETAVEPWGRVEEPMEVNAVARAVAALRLMDEPEGAVGGTTAVTTGTAGVESTDQALARLSLQLEEIAMVTRAPAPTPAPAPSRANVTPMEQVLAAIVKLNNQIGGLSKEMTKLKGQTLHVATPPAKHQDATPANRGSGTGDWTADRQPICYECKEIGHMGRDCPVRARRLANIRSGNGNAPQ